MMLKRLYSDTGLLLKPIPFHTGINIILGRYKEPQNKRGAGLNGIGKSSVVRLVDYLLLSREADRIFSQTKYAFMRKEGHTVTLELEIGGQLLAITRSFGRERDAVRLQQGNGPAQIYSVKEVESILNRKFFPSSEERLLHGQRYRSLMTFYVKDDLDQSVRKLNPVAYLAHAGANKREMTLLNAFLMGLPMAGLVEWEHKVSRAEEKQAELKLLTKRLIEAEGKPLGQIRAAVQSKEAGLAKQQEALNQYDLSQDLRNLSDAIGELDMMIVPLRRQVEQMERERERLAQFLRAKRDIDIQEVSAQYEAVSRSLGAAVKRTLQEVIEFRESVASERQRFYGKQLSSLEDKHADCVAQLRELFSKRAALYQAIDARGVSEPLRDAFTRLAIERADIAVQLEKLKDIRDAEIRVDELNAEAEAARAKVSRLMDDAEETIESLRDMFSMAVSAALDEEPGQAEAAFLDISRRSGRNSVPISIEVEVPKADALGNQRLKVASYDLTLFLHAIKANLPLPQFLVHDGVFHGTTRRTVIRTLNFVHQRLTENPGQYIVSFNEDELPLTTEQERDGVFAFDAQKATVIVLSEAPNERLFKHEF